jgi:putative membrane protein
MLVVAPVSLLVRMLPLLLVLLITGRGDPVRLWFTVGIAGLLVVLGVIRWRTTRYRITDERVELHSGWLNRQRRSVPRDRLRTVDLTATLLHRAFGLSVLHVHAGTGRSTEDHGLKLDAVSTTEAERLRGVLLASRPGAAPATGSRSRAPEAAAPSGTAGSDAPVATLPDSTAPTARGSAPAGPETTAAGRPVEAPEELARLNWSWIRFAPLTVSSLAGTGAIVAAVWNLFGDLGVDPRDVPVLDEAAERLFAAAVWVTIGVLGALLLVVAVVGALLLFTERWWDYTLHREPDGTLRVRRGLLTRRSLSVSGARLRGVAVSEPLLLRAGRGAQTRALATGLGHGSQGGALQPPVPRREAHRIAELVLREPAAATTAAPLRPHPRRALGRRLTRAIVPAAVFAASAWLLGALLPWWSWLGPVSLFTLALAPFVAVDRYRNLGHTLTPRHLVSRLGSLHRRTVALDRSGVIGWTFRQSVFQRRAGLVTVEAVTAAGDGGYRVLDVASDDGIALAAATTPGVLDDLREPG